jgi:signal transduction histidine kinase
VSLFVNAVDGLHFRSGFPHSLVLLPLVVLYGALLGDVWLSLVALGGVAAVYGYAAYRLSPLSQYDLLVLTDLAVLALFSGAAALGAWLRHRRLARELVLRADNLRRELDLRVRLQAIISHDIRNPLTILVHAARLRDPQKVETMARRIAGIVDSAADVTSAGAIRLAAVSAQDVSRYLNEVFAPRLVEKDLTLTLGLDPGFTVVTDAALLCDSILGNIVSNAVKYAPRGTTVTVTTGSAAADGVRIVVTDQGAGFPETVFNGGPDRLTGRSSPGTEGESGTGYGLSIAALCAGRLGGHVEVRNVAEGGAAVAVCLPRKPRIDAA